MATACKSEGKAVGSLSEIFTFLFAVSVAKKMHAAVLMIRLV